MHETNLQHRLQTNPNLIVWPGHDLAFFLADEKGRLRDAFRLPDPAIEMLLAFNQPRRIHDAPGGAEAVPQIQGAIDRSLLLPAKGRGEFVPHPALLRWAGFRIGDYPAPPAPRVFKQLVTARHSLGSATITVLDRVFDPEWLNSTYRWFFQIVYHGLPVEARSTGKAWHSVAEFSPGARFVAAVPVFAMLDAMAREATPKRRLRLKRIWACCAPSGHQSEAHREPGGDDGVTAIYFGNAHWDAAWEGEVTFYSDHGVAAVIVQPTPGRLVVFDNRAIHRIAIPSRTSEQARYTLVLNFATP